MELRNLRHAVMLAAERNFARAAERLHITQPALTRSIQALEQELGVQLFNRRRSGVTLTVIGESLIERAEDLLRRTRGLEQEVTRMRALEIGALAFGLAPLPSALFVARLLRELHAGYPGLRISIEVSSGAALLASLLAERIEFFICDPRQVPAAEGLTTTPLQVAAFSLYARPGHPLAHRTEVLPIAALRDYTLAAGHLTDVAAVKMRQWFGVAEADELPIAIQCNDQSALKSLVLESDAILLTAAALVADECADGRLVELRVTGAEALQASLLVFALDGRSLSPAAALTLATLKEWAKTGSAD